MCRDAVRPSRPIVATRPGSPKQWSPCRCVMKMQLMREKLRCSRRSCNCVPSPQSNIKSLFRTLATKDDGRCLPVGSALPHPSTLTSKRSITRQTYTLFPKQQCFASRQTDAFGVDKCFWGAACACLRRDKIRISVKKWRKRRAYQMQFVNLKRRAAATLSLPGFRSAEFSPACAHLPI